MIQRYDTTIWYNSTLKDYTIIQRRSIYPKDCVSPLISILIVCYLNNCDDSSTLKWPIKEGNAFYSVVIEIMSELNSTVSIYINHNWCWKLKGTHHHFSFSSIHLLTQIWLCLVYILIPRIENFITSHCTKLDTVYILYTLWYDED